MKGSPLAEELARISLGEITFHPHSYGDPAGRLFQWHGKLYRGISPNQAPLFERLFRDEVVRGLTDRGLLVESDVTALRLDGHAMVVRHRTVPFVSYPEEWSPAMLKDVALLIVDLAIELDAHGLTLKDGHPWNVLFDGCQPTFVDLTSIVTGEATGWPAYDSFRRFLLNPLVLMAHGHERIARRLLPEEDGIRDSEVRALTGAWSVRGLVRSALARAWPRLNGLLGPCRSLGTEIAAATASLGPRPGGPRSRLDILKDARRQIERISLPGPSVASAETPSTNWPDSRQTLDRLMSNLRPDSVLDVGSSGGWAAKLAAQYCGRVVYCQPTSAAVSQVYRDAGEGRMPILPLTMDVVDPTPSRGIRGHWAIAATERFGCDAVLALGVLPRRIHDRRITVEQIVDGLAAFSRRWLVVDSTTGDDDDSRREHQSVTEQELRLALRRRFSAVTTVSPRSSTQVLLLCEK